MGMLSKLFTRSNEERLQVQTGNQPSLLPPVFSLFAGGPSDAGVTVDQVSALTVTTVLRCVSLIASTIGTLPLHVVTQADGQKVKGHSLQPLLLRAPNEFMNQVVFREALMTNALLWGAGYAYIERDTLGQPLGLFPLRSSVTRPVRLDGTLSYITQLGTEVQYLRPDQILVVNGGITLDGISPLAPVGNGRNAIGLSLALEKFAGKFFSNGGNIGGILQVPQGMSPEAIDNFKSSWVRNYTGPNNSLKTAVLTGDMKFTKTGTEPEAGQMLGSREHQVREICRVFGVPPHLAFDLSKASYASIEQQSLEFMQYGIQPHCVRLEQEAAGKLLLTREQDELEIRFDLTAMLRTDTVARYSAYNTGLQAGFLTVNEVRAKEGLAPVTGGDVLRVPLNMGPAASPSTTATAPTLPGPMPSGESA